MKHNQSTQTKKFKMFTDNENYSLDLAEDFYAEENEIEEIYPRLQDEVELPF